MPTLHPLGGVTREFRMGGQDPLESRLIASLDGALQLLGLSTELTQIWSIWQRSHAGLLPIPRVGWLGRVGDPIRHVNPQVDSVLAADGRRPAPL
jgi:hypothetical protein